MVELDRIGLVNSIIFAKKYFFARLGIFCMFTGLMRGDEVDFVWKMIVLARAAPPWRRNEPFHFSSHLAVTIGAQRRKGYRLLCSSMVFNQ